MNSVTKSGTNEFHGDMFWFLRNAAANGRDAFAPQNDQLKRNQFGGVIGGPLMKDKAFFFGAYEGQIYDVGNSFGGVTSPSMISLPTVAPGNPGFCAFTATGDCGNYCGG